jgi:retron-type reverse transcriptase
VAEVITNEGTQWVVEADIKGFFDHVSHTHLVRFLEHRIADPKLLRLVQRFLKVGIPMKVDTCSEGLLPGIPTQSCHPFRRIVATLSN